MLAAVFCLTSASPALAQELGDYFQISYDPTVFDKTEIQADEVFQATITGQAVCSRDLPLPVSEAKITSRVIARHTVSGTTVILNPEYVIEIKPFPDRAGDTVEITKTIPLQFPAGAPSGDYDIFGELIEAKVKVIFWLPVTSILPDEQAMGTVQYNVPEPVQSPGQSVDNASPPPESPSPSEASPPSDSSPSPTSEPEPVSSPSASVPTSSPETEQTLPWWACLIVLIAIGTIVFNVVWFFSHRRK